MLECLSRILPIIQDFVTTIAAGVAIYVAIEGLSAWKKQLKGKADYHLAKQYLKAVYKIRNEMNKRVRNPFIPVYEMRAARKEEGLESNDISGSDKETNRLVYARRWRGIMNASENIETILLEVEVVWGREAVNVQKEFDDCIKELYVVLMRFLDDRSQGSIGEDDIIYSTEGSAFTAKIDLSIKKIKEYLKRYLK